MKNLYFTEDNPDFEQFFYSILQKFGITVNKDYQFVYDEFLKNLIYYTIKNVEEHFNPNYLKKDGTLVNKTTYTFVVFKRNFTIHFSDILRSPENYPEFKRRIRIDKLNKILQNGWI